jgi:tRNA modification GTPase
VYERDTIAAIATPPGQGGVAIIRVSGAQAETVARQVFVFAHPSDQLVSHHFYFGRISDPVTGSSLDQGLLVLMRSPRSYTGEDVVELHCHGGSWLSRRILAAVLGQGARLATPGEFTKRAFLNGRLDLSQAEAVLDLIQAKSDRGLSLAWEQLSGRLAAACAGLRERLLGLTAYVEAFIDFPDEDIPERSRTELGQELCTLIADVEALGATFSQGKVYREGIRTVIIGKPNVGKSSLLNLLAGSERAIVTAVPGTTRDVLEETIVIGGIPLVVWDTAGLRRPADEVERIGVERARSGLRAAELVLAVFDASRPFADEDEAVCREVADKNVIPVLNKNDLPLVLNPLEPERRLHAGPLVRLSAKSGIGVEQLVERIQQVTLGEQSACRQAQGGEVIVSRERHSAALGKTVQNLRHATAGLSEGVPLDLVSVDLRAALDHIGEITGHVSTEDILDKVFREFCIGK